MPCLPDLYDILPVHVCLFHIQFIGNSAHRCKSLFPALVFLAFSTIPRAGICYRIRIITGYYGRLQKFVDRPETIGFQMRGMALSGYFLFFPLIQLSIVSFSNRQTLPILTDGIFPSAAYLQMVISCNFKYFAMSPVVLISDIISSFPFY